MKKMCSEILIKVHLGLVACMFLTLRLVVGTSKPVDYEIRTLTGEPDYKSVNLTWEIENSPQQNNERNSVVPKVFTIFYCELQSFGPHRCRSKVIEENSIEEDDDIIRHYSTTIENLRMATKYSFHIKPQAKRKQQKVSGRSDSRDNEVHTESMFSGQAIVIPTKGFSAQATKCLPHISEIEVQTGPYFGGKIVVDGGNCGIQGNPKDPVDKYVMRIDHAKCGSLVKPETNTVETFITVQENLGIFTHSTRRFVVVCTFQSGIQTVRASFTVPGKGGVAPILDDQIETERSGRERQFRMVDKSALVLKEPIENIKPKDERDVENSVGTLEDVPQKSNNGNDIIPTDNPSDNLITDYNLEKASGHAKFAMLVDGTYAINGSFEPRINPEVNYTGLVIAVSLSLIMIGVFIYILQREIRRLNSFDGLPKRQIMRNQ